MWIARINGNTPHLEWTGDKGQAITLTPSMTPKHVVVIILEPVFQSCLSTSIQYTYNKRLGGLSCCEILAWLQTESNSLWNIRAWGRNCHCPRLISQGVVMIIHDECKSQSFTTIHCTYNERLEWLGGCEFPVSMGTHPIWCEQWARAKP